MQNSVKHEIRPQKYQTILLWAVDSKNGLIERLLMYRGSTRTSKAQAVVRSCTFVQHDVGMSN
jgi:hypothetical protein